MLKVSLALVSLAAAASISCAPKPLVAMPAGAVDKKLSTFAFIEDGKLITFVVDTRTTRDRGNEKFIPFEIAVANHGIKDLTLTRESFTLVDAQGNRYPCANARELLEDYSPLDFDRRLAELEGILGTRFAAITRYPSMFSPTRDAEVRPFSSTLVREAISVPQYGYIIDYLYFPTPKGGVLNQHFEMFLTAPELADPIFVKFVVK